MTLIVEIVKRETVKPLSPTPPELRRFELSLFDQFYPIFYTPFILFYTGGGGGSVAASERSRWLVAALSEVLARFYTLAGRIVDNSLLECVDQGAEYLEAAVGCDLSRVLEEPDMAVLGKFLPPTADIESADVAAMPLVLVQVNFFECGGSAISLCVMHKVADAETMCAFAKAWAGVANQAINEATIPEFSMASMFPPLDSLANSYPSSIPVKNKCVRLQKRIAGWGGPEPTAGEAISALVWKCSAAASRKNNTNIDKTATPRPTMLSQTVNLRRWMEPQLPSKLAGNLVGEALKGYCEHHVRRLQGDDACEAICELSEEFGELQAKSLIEDEMDFYSCTSWCRFPFYEANFGWGRPVWACRESAEGGGPNSILLMDARDGGGIEVWLALSEEDMALAEHYPDLREFASLNPSNRW
ncbi:hypothetical protein BT93_H3429 [Corymbia citriodora subsp. variegata]|nr:hypothetical protein BT93_H3429 [Corymbia citriodora subsp. variegata]